MDVPQFHLFRPLIGVWVSDENLSQVEFDKIIIKNSYHDNLYKFLISLILM